MIAVALWFFRKLESIAFVWKQFLGTGGRAGWYGVGGIREAWMMGCMERWERGWGKENGERKKGLIVELRGERNDS